MNEPGTLRETPHPPGALERRSEKRIGDDALNRIRRLVVVDNALVGLVIDTRYEVVRRIARGGMGEVYLAQDRRLNRAIAMKILAAEVSGSRWAERFEAEARLMTRLEHPGIVPIHDLGTLPDGRLYYTMKFVQGRNLEEMIAEGEERDRLLGILETVCDIVQHAHERDVVHRDLKPANIMVDEQNHVFVLDWGIARILQEFRLSHPDAGTLHTGFTSMGTVLGTIEYMPPEQARGELDAIDARSDVYSLGAILYELLASRPPVDRSTPTAMIRDVEEGAIAPLRERVPSISPDLDAICRMAMQREPRFRYPSARLLKEDLKRWREGRPVAARPVGPFGRLLKLVRRQPRSAAFVTAAVVAATAALSLLLPLLWRKSSELERITLETRQREESLRILETARTCLSSAARVLYDRDASPEELRERVKRSQLLIEQAVAKAPHLPLAHTLLGQSWEILGEWGKAESCWRTAVDRDGNFGPAHFLLGRMLAARAFLSSLGAGAEERAARREEAERTAREAERELALAMRDGSGFQDALQREAALALLAYLRGDGPEILRIAGGGVLRFGSSEGVEEFHWMTGLASRGAERIEAYTRAIGMRPKFPIALFCRGLARFKEQEYRLAEEDFTEAIRCHPGFAAAYINRAAVRDARGDFETALDDYECVLNQDPGNVEALYNRAVVLKKSGDIDRALAEYDALLQQEPRHSRALLNRGLIRKGRKDLAGAEADWRKAVEVQPGYAMAHANLGALHAERGEKEEAIRCLEQALEVAPDDWPLRAAVLRDLARIKESDDP